MLESILPHWTHITWVPSNATRLQRYLIRRMREGKNMTTSILVGGKATRRRNVPLRRQVRPVEV